MAAKVYKNLIGGEWVESRSGKTFENQNPANVKDVVGIFPRSDEEDVNDAVDSAKQAFDRWRLTPAPRRGEIIYRCAQILQERKEDYAREMTREMGKVLKETRGDVQEAIDTAFYMAGEGRRLDGHTVPSELPNKFAMAVRVPLGVVGMITPWNFPMAIPSWKIFPAIICGNACVIKPAEDTPLSTVNLVRALMDAGLPPGVVNIVHGFGPEAGAPMLDHPNVRAISFTGSSEVGRIVGEAAARNFKPCSLEMGGKNAIIVLNDANVDLAIDGALWGGFGTTGQRCTAASRVIVQKGVYDQFADKFVSRAKALKIGPGIDEQNDMGPQINAQQVETTRKYVDIGKGEGAKLLTGGNRITSGGLESGYFFEPTIFGDAHGKMRIAQEEIFGPIVSVVPADSLEHAVEISNGVAYGLSSAVYTRDVNRAFKAMRDLQTGITYINAPTIGAEVHLPFGGTKATGNGHREGGIGAIDFYTQWKAIYVDYSDRLQRAQIDTGE
ncbi:MAG TPA: aldehyde dehydrogenase family protein [Terriglobales bacterium]|nr:aldehyde dehydrogenase family protein [Terriglobales bacterium]